MAENLEEIYSEDSEEFKYAESFCSDDSDEKSEIETIDSSNIASSENQVKSIAPLSSSNETGRSDYSAKSLENRMKFLGLGDVPSQGCIPPRKNMSFSNEEAFKIERDNQLLLKKIMHQQIQPKPKIPQTSPQPRLCSAALNRRKFLKKVEEDNLLLFRRLQKAKSCTETTRKFPGYPNL